MKLTIGNRHSIEGIIPHGPVSAQLAEASRVYCHLRDESGEGASTFPEGRAAIYRISYNGRVWLGKSVVYDPRAVGHPARGGAKGAHRNAADHGEGVQGDRIALEVLV